MGISKRLFVEAPEEDHLCDRCGQVLEDPINLEPCDHTFCSSCLFPGADPATVTTLPTPRQCPAMTVSCHQQGTGHKKPLGKYNNMLNRLVLYCPTKEAGCAWKGLLGDLKAHREDCEYNPNKQVNCDKKGCGARFARREKESHNCLEYVKEKLMKKQQKLDKTRQRVRELDPCALMSSSSSSEAEEDLSVSVPVQSSSKGKGPPKGNNNLASSSTKAKGTDNNNQEVNKSRKRVREPEPEPVVLSSEEEEDDLYYRVVAPVQSSSREKVQRNGNRTSASAPFQRRGQETPIQPQARPPPVDNAAVASSSNNQESNLNNASALHNIKFVYHTLPPTGTNKKGKGSKRPPPLQLNVYQFDMATSSKTIKFKSPLVGGNSGYPFLSSTIKYEDKFYSIGGTYNPATRSEVGTTIIYEEGILEGVAGPNMKEKSKERGTTVLGSIIYAVGGCQKGNSAMNSVEFLKLETEDRRLKWDDDEDAIDYLTTLRGALSASSLNGSVYAIGGIGGGDVSLASVEVYTPANSKKWEKGPPLRTARGFHKSIVLGGRIYVVGGREQSMKTSDKVEWLDPREKKWMAAASMNQPRREFGLVADKNGTMMYAIGGAPPLKPQNRASSLPNPSPTVEFYDERRNKWELIDYPVNLDQNIDWMTICSVY